MSTNLAPGSKLFHAAVLLLSALWPSGVAAQSANAPPEIRAFWVDAFHAGIRSPQEAAQLVADAKRAGINTLIVQVRRRGDALYLKSTEPPLDDPNYNPQFDALAHILDAAHAAGLEVHAWINAMPVWRDQAPPRDPRHVFNRRGPATGADHWFTLSPRGDARFPVGYFLDPGHPEAAAHLAEIYLNVVRNYPVDGIHFDYIRYPETTERLERGAPVGYNPTSLARFRRATGRAADSAPEPADPAWIEWRRAQVTQLVRRIYIEAKAINPRIKVSAALIPWGRPPTGERDFENVAPMQRIFQDWHGWLKEGILDLGIPMNYLREHDPVQRGWFDGWIRFEKRHKHGRQIAVGIGAYVNAPQNTLAQIARTRRQDGGQRADGVSFFSYANLFPAAPPVNVGQTSRSVPSNTANTSIASAPAQPTAPAANASTKSTAAQSAPPAAAPASSPAANPAGAAVRAGAAFPVATSSDGPPTARPSTASRVAFLTEGAEGAPPAFAQPAAVPGMPWIERPTRGWLAGIALDASGKPADGAVIALRRGGWFRRTVRVTADGNGWFGFANLKPGRYRVRLERLATGRAPSDSAEVEVAAGKVARAELRPGPRAR